MRKLTAPVLLLAIALAGCSASPEAAPATETVTVSASPAPAETAPAAPVTTADKIEPSADATGAYGSYTQDEFYLASLKDTFIGHVPSDDDQIAAGHYACKLIAAGEPDPMVVKIGPMSEREHNNQNIVQFARQVYCPSDSTE